MKDAGFDFSKVILVTDRGYQSLINIQKQIDLEVKFIQGIRLSEDIVKRSFDRYDASLHNQRFYVLRERINYLPNERKNDLPQQVTTHDGRKT